MKLTKQPRGQDFERKATNQQKNVPKVIPNNKIKARTEAKKEAQIKEEREKVRITTVQFQLNHNHPYSLWDFAGG